MRLAHKSGGGGGVSAVNQRRQCSGLMKLQGWGTDVLLDEKTASPDWEESGLAPRGTFDQLGPDSRGLDSPGVDCTPPEVAMYSATWLRFSVLNTAVPVRSVTAVSVVMLPSPAVRVSITVALASNS